MPRRPPMRQKYPWQSYTNNREHVAKYGETFSVEPETFVIIAHNWAARNRLYLRTMMEGDNVRLRFFDDAQEAAEYTFTAGKSHVMRREIPLPPNATEHCTVCGETLAPWEISASVTECTGSNGAFQLFKITKELGEIPKVHSA